MKKVKGDLIKMFLNGEFDIIIHGANCQSLMGSGIAGQIARKIPEAYLMDRIYDRFQHNIDKLSNYSICSVRTKNGKVGYVINLYSQYMPGPDLDENALLLGFKKISKKILSGDGKTFKIGIPSIGCGIAGGDWNEIGPKIAKIMEDYDITHVEYEPIKKNT